MIRLFVLGAVLLTLLDAVHTHTGTTEYAHPIFFKAAWWVPLLFGGSAAIGGTLYARAFERLRPDVVLPSRAALLRGLFVMSVLYAASGLMPATSPSKAMVLLAGAIVLFRSLDSSRAGALLVLVSAIVGPLVEVTLVHFGSFRYLEPDFWGIPMWLPALYACVTPVFGQLARSNLVTRS